MPTLPLDRSARSAPTTLSPAEWRAREAAHQERADALTAPHRARAARHEKHPVEDFLFTYYTLRPAHLRRWSPGAGVGLAAGADSSLAANRWFRTDRAGTVSVDATAFLTQKAGTVHFIRDLLRNTEGRPARFGCFGLHEWAMVYRFTPEELRHRGLSLRLDHAATDAVVDSHQIGCSHFDAFRFFTPEARPLNQLGPTRENQAETEQSGCLHANMDLYKWAGKLGPLLPGDLLLDTFALALDVRRVDMRASPYDVTPYGLPAIPIESDAGKKEYVREQRGFAERGDRLRLRMLAAIELAEQRAEAAGSAAAPVSRGAVVLGSSPTNTPLTP